MGQTGQQPSWARLARGPPASATQRRPPPRAAHGREPRRRGGRERRGRDRGGQRSRPRPTARHHGRTHRRPPSPRRAPQRSNAHGASPARPSPELPVSSARSHGDRIPPHRAAIADARPPLTLGTLANVSVSTFRGAIAMAASAVPKSSGPQRLLTGVLAATSSRPRPRCATCRAPERRTGRRLAHRDDDTLLVAHGLVLLVLRLSSADVEHHRGHDASVDNPESVPTESEKRPRRSG